MAELADRWGSWENWLSDALLLCFIIYQTFFESIYIYFLCIHTFFIPADNGSLAKRLRSALRLFCLSRGGTQK